MTTHVLALDQGTTSTRAMVFDHAGQSLASAQVEHRQFNPRPGWVEHDPGEIWDNARAVIARALAARPELIVLDEAVSNLDLVLQLQVLDLLAQLRRQLGTAFLFITHDLRLTRRLCDRVLVMEEGRIVDAAKDVSGLHHPASRMLRESVLPARPT